MEELAAAVIAYTGKNYPGFLEERYQISKEEDAYRMLEEICISRHCFKKGQTPDITRAANMVLEDFRSGKIGRITLEQPEEWQ